MSDLIQDSMNTNQLGGNARMSFYVKFVTGEELFGTLHNLGSNTYMLNRNGTRYNFTADKVVWVRPSQD